MFNIYHKDYCGLDGHKTWVYACIGITDADGRTEYKEYRYSAFTRGLNQLVNFLARYSSNEVLHGIGRRTLVPVFNVLEKHVS